MKKKIKKIKNQDTETYWTRLPKPKNSVIVEDLKYMRSRYDMIANAITKGGDKNDTKHN